MRLLMWLPGRLLSALVVLFGASVLIFFALRSLPGDFAQIIAGPLASDAMKDQVRTTFGLDRPLYEQYALWIGAAFRGDFGISAASQQPVINEILSRIPITGIIGGIAMLLTVLIGVPLGVFAATSAKDGRSSVAGRIVSIIGISTPEFVLGSIVVFLFSRFQLGIPVGSFTSPFDDFGAGMRSIILPAIVLSVFCIAAAARTTRDAVLSVLVEPYIAASVSRGESKWFIIRHHVLRNSMVPVFTLIATLTAYQLGGAVIVENVFDVPGFGSYLVTALGRRDYAVIQAGVLLVTAIFVVVSFIIDIVTSLVDPRISTIQRSEGRKA